MNENGGKTVVITGASDGVGAAGARLLARTNPRDRLIVVGRNPAKTAAVAADIGAEHYTADFASLGEVRELAAKLATHGPIDVLANNAGGMFDGPLHTADGFERNWQVNVVAPFLLTSLLRPHLRGSVVNTSSMASHLLSSFDPKDPDTSHKFTPERAYGNAKLGVNLMTRFISLYGVPTVAFHPGVIASSFGGNSTGAFSRLYALPVSKRVMSTPERGAETLAYFVTGQPGIHYESGEYYGKPGRKGLAKRASKDRVLAQRIFSELATRLDVEWRA